MAKILDTLNWVQDGEGFREAVLNRPLKELADLLDKGSLNTVSKIQGYPVDTTEIDSSVALENLVYRASTGAYFKALGGDSTKEKVIGFYTNVEGNPFIVTGGLYTTSGLTTGKTYYLSDSTEGALTDTEYQGAIRIGYALSDTVLYVNIGSSSSGSGSSSVELEAGTVIDSNVFDGAWVYRKSDGTVANAINDGTEASNVIGIYKIINNRNYIIYNSETDYDAFNLINENLVTGLQYYLSPTEPGKIQKTAYSGAVKVGTAVGPGRILVDIDTASGNDNSEELEYHFLLSTSDYEKCYYDVFNELDTMDTTNGGTYSAINTAYILNTNEYIVSNDDLLANIGQESEFVFYVNTDGLDTDYNLYYSTDGTTFTAIPSDNKLILENPISNLYLKIESLKDALTVFSYGMLTEPSAFIGNSRVKIKEKRTFDADTPSGTVIYLPARRKYTKDNKSLNVFYNGYLLEVDLHYTENTDDSIIINIDILAGDTLVFEEYYGYVDVSLENTTRVNALYRYDRIFANLDATNILYNSNNKVIEIDYITGNKETWTRDSNDLITRIDYYDTDGSTLLAHNDFTYNVDNLLISNTWTNV